MTRRRAAPPSARVALVGLVVGALAVLTACGSSTGDRALSGAGIGAATDKDDIDLGKPIWR